MVKEVKGEMIVGVQIEALWKALSKDLILLGPKIAPNLINNVQIIEGNDINIDTVLLFSFGSDASNIVSQEEKIVELDECDHRYGLQVMKGGHLNHGFASYRTSFKLTEFQEKGTLVNITITYECAVEDIIMPSKSIQASTGFIKSLESYLLNAAA